MLAAAWEYLTSADSWWGQRGLVNLTYNHLRLALFSTFVAALVAIPPALWLGHIRRGGLLAVSAVNVSRAIPSFAVIALVFPISLEYGFGLGFWPTFVALLLLALPPMFANSYTGVRGVDDDLLDAARGMGMRRSEVLRKVEVPAALPLILASVRVSAVQVMATTTLGALVGFDCLGTPIIIGLRSGREGPLVGAAILVAALTLITDLALGLLQRRLTPWVPRRRVRRGAVAAPAPA